MSSQKLVNSHWPSVFQQKGVICSHLLTRTWSIDADCVQANNPVRSRAHDNATGTIASGLDMWHDAHGASQSARFASHSAWELQHDESITKEQARQA